ncbi:cyclic nucleotide-binding domain-containing protein [Magnetospirillum moscoviense]|uniref:cAMP-binding protein n=1 Tax=Magnetospirillum moscoviense TaxID=1437059 RepID=A0A178M8H5_9PROT|nr:cyclic nucleotide-binding domain-containing protein [Magnetospirillum moscoviense]OAN44517.1 cAMP-binding protein [Magnetospirillum moscoviense]
MAHGPVLDRRSFGAGEVIFKEGDHGSVAYIVQTGTVELSRGRTKIADLNDGAIFGEMALIDGAPRMATATAKTNVNVIVLPKMLVDSKLAGVDPFVTRLLHILINNVRNFARLVD